MDAVTTVLLLGGTAEARALAAALEGAPGLALVSSLAGRVARPALPVGEVRVGGFGGVEGMVGWLSEHPPVLVVDATHPFAARITAHAAQACERAGVALLRLQRPGWHVGAGDDWHRVTDVAAAAQALPTLGTRPFLTTGRGGLDVFAARPITALARCVDPPEKALPPTWTLRLDRGPYVEAGERQLMLDHAADVLVTKDSGGQLTAAKLAAARDLGLPVLMVDRPELPAGVPVVESVGDAEQWVRSRAGEA